MRILFLSRWFPVPADNGSKQRVLHLLMALAARHEVSLVSFVSETPAEDELSAMKTICPEVHTVPLRDFRPQRLAGYLGLLSAVPRSVSATHSPQMQLIVESLRETGHYDIVIASQIDMAPYALEPSRIPRLLDELELTALYDQYSTAASLPMRVRRGLMWAKRSAYVRYVLRGFDACTVVSAREAGFARRLVSDPTSVEVVPNGVDGGGRALPDPIPGTIIYSGSVTYPPNLDAVEYFVRRILPRVQAEWPEAKFTISGRTGTVDVQSLEQSPRVTFAGYIQDIRSAVAASWLSVAPIRRGGGTRLKILESLSVGTPVVSTSKGVEGLELIPGEHLLVADDVDSFSACVIRLLADSDLRSRIGGAGRGEVMRRYSWEIIGPAFVDLVGRVASKERG